MKFDVMWKDIKVAELIIDNNKVMYSLIDENIIIAKEKGMLVSSIMRNKNEQETVLPIWIDERIPLHIKDKIKWLEDTEGRCETDNLFFLKN